MAAKRWLENNDHWLLIFDNANRPDLLKPFLPRPPRGHVLITSRARVFDAIGIVKPVDIEALPPQEAFDFLFKRTDANPQNQEETKAAQALADELGYLPLALEQAAAYVLTKGARFETYLKSYQQRRLKLLESQKPRLGDYPASVATTWDINFQEVKAASGAAVDLLNLSAFLSPTAIPMELITQGATQLGPTLAAALADAIDDPLLVDEALAPLTDYSLIRRDHETNSYSIHRLVQEVLKDDLGDDLQRVWTERMVNAIAQVFPPAYYENWSLCDRLLPHAEAALPLIDRWQLELPSVGRLLNLIAFYRIEHGSFSDVESLLKRAVAVREKSLGADHIDVAESLNDLANLCNSRSQDSQAEALHKRALDIRQKVLGLEDTKVARSLNNLASLYNKQGDYTKAEAMHKQALAINVKALGPEHPDSARSLNNLGSVYSKQGSYGKAEAAYKQALAIREKSPEHPDTAGSLNNLATLYYKQHRYKEAKPLAKRALDIIEKRLSAEHPKTAIYLENYAAILRGLNWHQEAKKYESRAKRIQSKHQQQNSIAPMNE